MLFRSLVVIGKVANRESFRTDNKYGDMIMSIVTFSVETVIHGASGSQIQFLIWGGTLGNGEGSVFSEFPRADPGSRYLILFNMPSGVALARPKLMDVQTYLEQYPGPMIVEYFEMDSKAPLIGEQEMKDMYREHCTKDLSVQARKPTAKYIELLPSGFKDWCEHY